MTVTIDPKIRAALQRLGWTLIKPQSYGGRTSYLVRDDHYITEPYTARAILQAAATLPPRQDQRSGPGLPGGSRARRPV